MYVYYFLKLDITNKEQKEKLLSRLYFYFVESNILIKLVNKKSYN